MQITMTLNLEPVFENEGFSIPVCYKMDLSDEVFFDNKPFVEPIDVQGRVFNHSGIVTLAADVTFCMHLDCDRCAQQMQYQDTLHTTHTLVTQLQNEEDDAYILLDSMQIDLDKILREDIYLSLPTVILCGPECKGVCPYCGQNRNHSQCSCKKPADPRLETLQQLLNPE